MADLEEFRSESAAAGSRRTRPSRSAAWFRRHRWAHGNWGGRNAERSTHPDMKPWLEMMGRDAAGRRRPGPRSTAAAGSRRTRPRCSPRRSRGCKLPPPLIGFGLTMIGPTLLRFGTEEQKREHLPKICRGEIRWCQGYSEPGRRLRPGVAPDPRRARRRRLHHQRQKVWTSYADLSDWIFALVRTDPDAKKQAGITFILIDMETPGVSVSPIR